MNYKSIPIAISCGLAASIMLGYASVVAADTPTYEESEAYIQEKGISKDIRSNEYYDPSKESDYQTTVKREVYRKIQFPSYCVMEIVNERFEEVAPPTNSNLDNNYGFTELEILTVKLNKVVPSQIYNSKRPPDGTAVILKARKGGIISKTEKYFDLADNKSIYGVTMNDAAKNSIDSPFGKFECSKETCTRFRAFNGYGITPSKKIYTDGLRDALIDIVKLCGGTG